MNTQLKAVDKFETQKKGYNISIKKVKLHEFKKMKTTVFVNFLILLNTFIIITQDGSKIQKMITSRNPENRMKNLIKCSSE